MKQNKEKYTNRKRMLVNTFTCYSFKKNGLTLRSSELRMTSSIINQEDNEETNSNIKTIASYWPIIQSNIANHSIQYSHKQTKVSFNLDISALRIVFWKYSHCWSHCTWHLKKDNLLTRFFKIKWMKILHTCNGRLSTLWSFCKNFHVIYHGLQFNLC